VFSRGSLSRVQSFGLAILMASENQAERDRQDFLLKLALVASTGSPGKGLEVFNLLAKAKTKRIEATTDSGISEALEVEEAGGSSTWELSGEITPDAFEAILADLSRAQVGTISDGEWQ
jgi:hypothetical protein